MDKIFWFRAGLGAVGGSVSELLFGCKVNVSPPNVGSCVGGAVPDYSTGILLALFIFLASYYLVRMTIGKKFPKDQQGKVYTAGAGTYALLYIFSWVLLYTLGVTYLNL
jgi:hypothetical protein